MLTILSLRKYGQTDRMDNTTEALMRPEVAQWLSKYLIKQKDESTLLVYPRTGSGQDQTNNTDHLDHNKTEEDTQDILSVEEKHKKIIKLKKLLEMKLRKKLDYKKNIVTQDFSPSPKIR